MEKKNLADAVLPSVEERYEWQSFLGLLPVLDLSAVDPVRYQRCMRAVWELREKVTITRSALMVACGLAFHDSSLESDLLLAALVRDEVLEPVPSAPFCFRVRAWLEFANTIDGNDANTTRSSIERSAEPVIQQLELPMDNDRISFRQGEERCNK